jgi:ubiquinone/menaquinone biosynthesis C-methylase UbiE
MKRYSDARTIQRSEREHFDHKVAQEANVLEEDMDSQKARMWLDILGLEGALRGRNVLECACGTGKLTTVLARQARSVRSFDISPESVRITTQRIEKEHLNNVQVEVASMEELPYEDESFDIVVGLFILHHLADLEQGIKQIFRVLRPGGKAVFYETSGSNPILMFWRGRLTGRLGIPKLGTKDEHPLTTADLETIASAFRGTTKISYPRFRFFGKLYFQLLQGFKMARSLCDGLDNAVYRCFPFFRKYSYQVMVTLIK